MNSQKGQVDTKTPDVTDKSVNPLLSNLKQKISDMRVQGDRILAEKKDGAAFASPKLIETALRYGSELAKSFDPLADALDVTGSTILGTCLSKFSASQCAGLVGVIVASLAPQVRIYR